RRSGPGTSEPERRAEGQPPGGSRDEAGAPERDVYLVRGSVDGDGVRRTGTRQAIPAGPALPQSLALGRALRPLRVRRPSRTRTRVDEARTASRAVRLGYWHPVLRPTLQRWPDLALVVDVQPPSVWDGVLAGLELLLDHLGAFRDFRAWRLHPGRGDGAEPVVLRIGLEDTAANRTAGTHALRDPTGRRLVLVVTDGIDPAGAAGGYAGMLGTLASPSPVVVMSLSPRWLWPPHGLRTRSREVRLDAPLLPNLRWHMGAEAPRASDTDAPVPVADFNPWRLGR